MPSRPMFWEGQNGAETVRSETGLASSLSLREPQPAIPTGKADPIREAGTIFPPEVV
jgi:hypothetical protein